jgi:hypothetical protein
MHARSPKANSEMYRVETMADALPTVLKLTKTAMP